MLMIENDVSNFDHFYFAEYSNLENINWVIINQIIDESSWFKLILAKNRLIKCIRFTIKEVKMKKWRFIAVKCLKWDHSIELFFWDAIAQIFHRFENFRSQIDWKINRNSYNSSFEDKYFVNSFNHVILNRDVWNCSFDDYVFEFHEIIVFVIQDLFVIDSKKFHRCIEFNCCHFKKFFDCWQNIVFSKMNIDKIHSWFETFEMINSIIFIVTFIHLNQIAVNSLKKFFDRLLLTC